MGINFKLNELELGSSDCNFDLVVFLFVYHL